MTTQLRALLAAASVVTAACGTTAGASPGPSPGLTATAAATFSVPATFATVCGRASDPIARTPTTNATFVLNSPGRAPLTIASTWSAPIDATIPGGYACLLLDAGVPFPILSALLGTYQEGFVNEGTFPATSAKPAPTGFVLPQACAFVAPPVVGTETTVWSVSCGGQLDRDARGMLGPALAQQGWTTCSLGLGMMSVRKNGVMLVISESSMAPGEYPHVTQFARVVSPCS